MVTSLSLPLLGDWSPHTKRIEILVTKTMTNSLHNDHEEAINKKGMIEQPINDSSKVSYKLCFSASALS